MGLGQYGIGVSFKKGQDDYYVTHSKKHLYATGLGYKPFSKSKLAMQFIARAVKLDLKANEETAFDPHLSSPDELVQYVGQCKEEVDACLAGLIKANTPKTLEMLEVCALKGVQLMRTAVKERK